MVRAYQIFHQPFAALVAQDYMALSTLFSYTIRSHWQKTKIEDQELTDGSKPVSTCECYQGMEAEGSLDAKRIKVDFISLTSTPPILFLAIVSILFLCVIDAILTLFLQNHGAYEINPIMAYLLNYGPYVFFVSKYILTIVATLGLFVFRCVVIRRINASTHFLLYLLACAYAAIVAWELYLVYFVI